MKVSIYEKGRFLRAHALEREVVRIGRLPSCDLILDGDGVARYHAFIERSRDGGWTIVGMGPTGTRVNGKDVTRARVGVGDELSIGDYRILFMDEEPPELVIVPSDGELVAARVAPVLWAATAEEMDAEEATGEVEPIYLLTQRKRS